MPDEPVDFDAVKANAAKQGLPLSSIAIIYRDLTVEQFRIMEAAGVITHREADWSPPSDGTAIAHFSETGDALFPDKATAVISLAAD